MPIFTQVQLTADAEHLERTGESLYPVTNVENRTSTPPFVNGFRWLTEADLAPGAVPSIGAFWNGALPATFVPMPVVEIGPDGPQTAQEAWSMIQQKKAELAEAEARFALIQGLD